MVERYEELTGLVEMLKNAKELDEYCDNVAKVQKKNAHAIRLDLYCYGQTIIRHFHAASVNTAQPSQLRKKAEEIALSVVDVMVPLYEREPDQHVIAVLELIRLYEDKVQISQTLS